MSSAQFLVVLGLLLAIYGSGEVNARRNLVNARRNLVLDWLDALVMIVGLIALASGTVLFILGMFSWLW